MLGYCLKAKQFTTIYRRCPHTLLYGDIEFRVGLQIWVAHEVVKTETAAVHAAHPPKGVKDGQQIDKEVLPGQERQLAKGCSFFHVRYTRV